MKNFALWIAAVATMVLVAGCGQEPEQAEPAPQPDTSTTDREATNPLLDRYLTPYSAPPFHKLEAGHFQPALEEAISDHQSTIDEITDNPEAPDFDNTIAALEHSSADLSRIARTFFALSAVSPDDAFREIAPEISRRLSSHNDAVVFNAELGERVRAAAEQTRADSYDPEQVRLAELTVDRFESAGAELEKDQQQRLESINSRLAENLQAFEQALREATHDHELLIEDESALTGLPDNLINLAARSARDRGHQHGWLFTLYAHSFYPFMKHFPERVKRQDHYQAWIEQFGHAGSGPSPRELMQRIAGLRAERAELLGYDSHIDYLLADSTLGDRESLRAILDRMTEAARKRSRRELEQLRDLAAEDGVEGELEPWDWWYYRQRLRESELELGDGQLRNWFELEQAREGAFALANRLWGLSFRARTDLPVWHPGVSSFEVRDARGRELGVLYTDYLNRPGKRGGAWTSIFRAQRRDQGERVAPIVTNVANFPPPAAGSPSLLDPDQVRTLFHEFGHALHELLSEVRYASLAGSAVPADFVEFPALLMERWALHPEALRMYAYHHETGNLIDDEAMQSLQRELRLLPGLELLQYIASIELDLALHGVGAEEVPDLEAAEKAIAERLELPRALSPRHHGLGVAGLFAVPRTGGDFRTLWSEILAADAFAAFEEATATDRRLTDRLREEILKRGNSRDHMESWQAFRGRAPEMHHFLEARGLEE